MIRMKDCMVMEVHFGKFRGLFTGDIGAETEKKLLDSMEDVDFLKVAHHGSKYSTCQGFLDVVSPEIAVISCSAKNTYGSIRRQYNKKAGRLRCAGGIYDEKRSNYCADRRGRNLAGQIYRLRKKKNRLY